MAFLCSLLLSDTDSNLFLYSMTLLCSLLFFFSQTVIAVKFLLHCTGMAADLHSKGLMDMGAQISLLTVYIVLHLDFQFLLDIHFLNSFFNLQSVLLTWIYISNYEKNDYLGMSGCFCSCYDLTRAHTINYGLYLDLSCQFIDRLFLNLNVPL